jgi:TetR/AcrR family tetracycline transcriptional repressor
VARKGEGLDRDTIVTVALELLDTVGLDGLTLRRLAQELGVQAPALYWHVRNKQELLDLMAARLIEEAPPADPDLVGRPWPELLTAAAHHQRQRLLAHRDGARLVAGTRPLETLLPRLEAMLGPFVAAGFTPGQALRAIMTISLFVSGFVLEEQAEQARLAERGISESDERAFGQLTSRSGLDTVRQAFRESGDPNGEQAFREGVQFIVDGLAVRWDAARRDLGRRQ